MRVKRYKSLKSKIRMGMFINTAVTLSLFTAALLVLISMILSSFGYLIAYSQSQRNADFIASQEFLEFAEIDALNQMTRPKYDKSWLEVVFESEDAIVLLRPDLLDDADFKRPFPSEKSTPVIESVEKLTALQFELDLGTRTVYATPEYHSDSFIQFLDTSVEVPFVSVTGEKGTVRGKVTPRLLEFIYLTISFLVVFIAGIGALTSVVTAGLISRKIIKPINMLSQKMTQIAEESLEEVVQHEIFVDKPVQELFVLTQASNKIFLKMRDFADCLEAQNEELAAQNDALEASANQLNALNREVNRYNQSLTNILDNTGQGFLAINRALKVQDVYSRECVEIFGQEISGMCYSELLYQTDEERSFIDRLLSKLFVVTEDTELYYSLLPSEWEHEGKFYLLDHKPIVTGENEVAIMVILTDVTLKKQIESEIHNEQTNLKRLVKIIRYQDEFKTLYSDILSYQEDIIREVKQEDLESIEAFYDFFRHLHNFKGLLSQYDFNRGIQLLDHLETACVSILNSKPYSSGDAYKLISTVDLPALLSEDLDVLTDDIGEDILEKSHLIRIDESKLNALENKLTALLHNDILNEVMPLLQGLRDRRLSQLFRSLPEYAEKLSVRLGKSINPMVIEGDEILCDTKRYIPLVKSMVHLVRNALDHGLEFSDDRLEHGKSENGTLSLEVRALNGNQIQIVFSDDGTGIDVEQLREVLSESGVFSDAEILQMTDERVMYTVFMEGVTTKSVSNDLSGRGMGLSSIFREVQLLEGSVEVQSELGRGTKFILTVPLIEKSYLIPLDKKAFESTVVYTFESTLASYGLTLKSIQPFVFQDRCKLQRFSAFLHTGGALRALVVLSMSEALIQSFGKNYFGYSGNLDKEECHNLVEELANIIVGNALPSLGLSSDSIKLHTPTLAVHDGAIIHYLDHSAFVACWSSGGYEAQLGIQYLE